MSSLSGLVATLQKGVERLQVQTQTNLPMMKDDIISAIETTAKANGVWQKGENQHPQDKIAEASLQSYFDRQSGDDCGTDKAAASIISNGLQHLISTITNFSTAAETIKRGQHLLDSLYFTNLRTRHRQIPKAHQNTFRWIFEESLPYPPARRIMFKNWLRRENGIFWIQGKAGSGKSTLMKFISSVASDTTLNLNAWAGRKRLVVASFFLWKSGNPLQKSQQGLLRSLLYEIIRNSPELIPAAVEIVSSSEDMHDPGHVSWSLETLLRMYKCVVTQTTLPSKFCFFIDGLDEFEDQHGTPDDLLKLLRNIKHSSNIKLCVSSRPWSIFSDEFDANPDWIHVLKLEDLTRGDISKYVTDKFNEHSQFSVLKGRDTNYQHLIDSVADRSQGVFLWVFLVVRNLIEGLTFHDSVLTLRRRLDAFPPDLEAFFELLIKSVPKIYRPQLATSFQVAIAAPGPALAMLYSFLDDVEEDQEFCAKLPAASLRAEEVRLRLDRLRRRLDGRSRGLLEIVESDDTLRHSPEIDSSSQQDGSPASAHHLFFHHSVDFLHRSVRDFINESPVVKSYINIELAHSKRMPILGYHATLALIKTAPRSEKVVEWAAYLIGVLFYFVLETQSNEPGADDPIRLLDEAKRHVTKLRAIELGPGSALWVEHEFLGLAAWNGFFEYLDKRLLPGYSSPTNGQIPLLGYALSLHDICNEINAAAVTYLLNHSASLNKSDLSGTVWPLFVSTLPLRASGGHNIDTLREVTVNLIRHGASLSKHIRRLSARADDQVKYGQSRFPHMPGTYAVQSATTVELDMGPASAADILENIFTPADLANMEAVEEEASAANTQRGLHRNFALTNTRDEIRSRGIMLRKPRMLDEHPLCTVL